LQDWTLSDLAINDAQSLAGRTLSPLYADNAEQFHVMYNDEHPHGPTSFDKGHTKVSQNFYDFVFYSGSIFFYSSMDCLNRTISFR
jgi:hypothetical protein